MKRKRLNSMPMEDELGWVFLSPLQHDVKQIFYFYRMDKWYVDKILANIVSKEISNKNNFQILSKIQNKTKIVNSILGIFNFILHFKCTLTTPQTNVFPCRFSSEGPNPH